jgi:multidrug efflux pump subunit AcrA (membrane-fusion protein)
MTTSGRHTLLWTYLAAGLAATFVLASSGCKNAADESPAVAVAVKAQHPRIGSISEEIAADAILAPLSQAALAPKISAPVREFYIQRGAHVHKGQLLASLEDRDLTGSALDSKGSLSVAEAAYETAVHATIPEEDQKAQLEVDQAKANLEVAKRTAEERKRLLDQGAIAGRDVDTAVAAQIQAQAAYDIAVKHLHSVDQTTRMANAKTAEGQLTSAKGRYESAEAQVSYSALRSPIDGVVTDRPLFAGETAAAGVPVITVMDTSSLLAKLHLAQAAAQKLKLGGEAEIRVAGVDEPVKASVSFISPALDPGSTTVEVWLKLPNADGSLKVGTPVHVIITGRTVQKAIQIPSSALLPSQDASNSVMIAGADGLAHKRVVTVGIRTSENIQITDGLSTADNVITEGSYGLDNETKITLAADKPDEGGEKPAAGSKE